MNEQEFAVKLDEMCREMPLAVEPRRDLWPGIAARLEGDQAPMAAAPRVEKLWPFAAGIAASALLALMTVLIARNVVQSPPPEARNVEPAPILVVMPQWIPEVRRTRNVYQREFLAGLSRLAPDTRALVEHDLAEIQQSMTDIQAALETDPDNVTLHRLLAMTYQQELHLVTTIGALQQTDSEL